MAQSGSPGMFSLPCSWEIQHSSQGGRPVAHERRKTPPPGGGARTAAHSQRRTVDFCLKTQSAPCPTIGLSSGGWRPLSEALSSRHPKYGAIRTPLTSVHSPPWGRWFGAERIVRRRLSVVEYNLKYDMHKFSRPSDNAGNLLIGGNGFETEEPMLRLEILPLSLNVTFLTFWGSRCGWTVGSWPLAATVQSAS